jgi:hypothetical protein
VVGVLFAAPLTAVAMVTIVHLYRFWLDLPDSLLSTRAAASAEGDVESPASGGAAPAGMAVSDIKPSVSG